MISNYMFQKVRALHKQGLSNRKIALELGIDRKTVGEYLKLNAPPKYAARSGKTRPDLFADFGGLATSLLASIPDLTAAEIFIAAKEAGYKGSERTVDRRVAAIKAQRPKERFFDQEYEPGEQAQFDFKESVELPFIEGERTCHLHFSTLPFSDFFWIKGFGFKTYEAFMDGTHSFFEEIGGMTEKVRIDNLSPCVRKILKGNKRLYTTAFCRAIAYYDFGVLPCRPGKGSDKGDVERDIRTHARRIKNRVKITGKVFKDFEDLNLWLAEYCVNYRLPKTGPLFAEEQLKLKPLPPRDEEVLCKVETTTASPYGTVRIGKTTYSVPDAAIGVACRVVASAFDVKIYQVGNRELVATHIRKTEGENSIPLEHVLPSLIRKPGAMVRWAHKAILFPTPVFTRFYEHLCQLLPDGGAEREYLRAINLVQYTTLAEIGAGMELVLEGASSSPFDDLKALVLTSGHHPPGSASMLTSVLDQIPLRPKLSMYDDLIPQLLETGT
jgi:transposase